MDSLIKDLRYGIRSLLRQPGFTAITVLTLALGIGANTAIFSVVYSVLIKPLPFHRPDRIVLLWGDDREEGDSRSQVSYTDIADFKAQQTLFDSITTFNSWTPLISGTGEPARINGALVGDDFFRVMGQQPLLGRAFLPEEQQDGKDQVVVLSYELWRIVVGVVRDVKQYGPDKPSEMAFYLPHAQYPVSFMSLVARTSTEPADMIATVRKTVQGLDPDQVPMNVATMEDVMMDSIQTRRFPMFVLGGFAALALALAAVGYTA